MANLKIKRCFRIETRVGKGVVELMFPSEGLNRSEGFPASLKGHPPGHLDVCCSSTRMSCGFSMDVDVVAQAALHHHITEVPFSRLRQVREPTALATRGSDQIVFVGGQSKPVFGLAPR